MSAPVLWTPSAAFAEQATMTRFMHAQGISDYEELWRWSISDIGVFWKAVWDFFGVVGNGDNTIAFEGIRMPEISWFPNVEVSYPEHIFKDRHPQSVAVRHASELRDLDTWTWAQLASETARIRDGLQRMGVTSGDRVAALMPNIPETLAAFLAVSSLGAIWSCCSPDFGARTAIARFAQIEPKVLLTVDGYRYGGNDFERLDVIDAMHRALPTLDQIVTLGYLDPQTDEWEATFPETSSPLEFERVSFDHPLWILYSSGTTGPPKAIVHGHGGILLDHLKWHGLHSDLKPGDRFFWYTTTGWMMWNALISGLLTGSEIVMFDGNPMKPTSDVLWNLAEQTGATTFGASAAFLHACIKAGVAPRSDGRTLSALRAIGSTGSPLSEEGFAWVYEQFDDQLWLFSTSGGTDVCTPFVGGSPIKPVRRGELQARQLGVSVETWDDDGHSVVGQVGELVVTEPMPSMPVYLWNDPHKERYRESYFDFFPGVWRHGDWLLLTEEGGAVIYGRSDATINRGGVRMGTAEIYGAVLGLDEILDALAVDVPGTNGTGSSSLLLFVILRDGVVLNDELRRQIVSTVRSEASPRHVPDEIIPVADIPRTRTGKPLEIPVKRLLMGLDPSSAASRDALENPTALDWFVRFADERLAST